MRARIVGIGQVSACGEGVEALRAALRGDRPAPERIPMKPPSRGIRVPVFTASTTRLAAMTEARLVRRLDPFSQRFLLAALLAVEDGGGIGAPERAGIVVATGYGPLATSFAFLDDVIDQGDDLGSPFKFSISVHNAPASSLSLLLGVTGPALTVTSFDGAWSRALGSAMRWLEDRTVDRAIVLAGDEYHDVLGYGLPDRVSTPHGETFVAMMLSRGDEGASPWGWMESPRPVEGPDEALRIVPGAPVFVSSGPRDATAGTYDSLWGTNPTADAMTSVVAALTLRDRVVYEPTGGPGLGPFAFDAGPAPALTAATCVSRDAPNAWIAIHHLSPTVGTE